MKRLDMTGDQFHPEWNYTIKPKATIIVAIIIRDVLGRAVRQKSTKTGAA